MTAANRAYEEGDEARLRAILEEYESSPDSVKGDGLGAELVRVIRKIAQAEGDSWKSTRKSRRLRMSERFELKEKVDEAATEGRDLCGTWARLWIHRLLFPENDSKAFPKGRTVRGRRKPEGQTSRIVN